MERLRQIRTPKRIETATYQEFTHVHDETTVVSQEPTQAEQLHQLRQRSPEAASPKLQTIPKPFPDHQRPGSQTRRPSPILHAQLTSSLSPIREQGDDGERGLSVVLEI